MAQPTTPEYKVNYEDERFGQVEADKNQALTELEQTYGGMIGQADQYYQSQIDATKQWADKQQQLQQEQTDFAIEQVQQQKDQAYKDYTKEQSGAYVDWQKNSDAYGAQAEQLAGAGLKNTGFAESSQVAMYTAYQNRVAVARDAQARAVLNYDNAIKDAQLQNNSVLAEIAFQALQKELELSLAGFQYKNQLVLEQANKKVELENTYYDRYLDVLNQINQENALAEEVRQYEQNFAEQQRQYNQQYELEVKQMDEQIRQYNQSYQQQVKEYNEGIRQFNEEIARLKAKDAQEYQLEIKNLELKKQQLAEEKKQYEADQKLKQEQLQLQRDQLAEEKRQYDTTLEYNKSKSGVNGGGGGSGGGSGGGTGTGKGIGGTGSGSKPMVTYDKDSLIKAGINPYVTSDTEIARQVANGTLSYKQVGNKLVFERTQAGNEALKKYTQIKPTTRVYK